MQFLASERYGFHVEWIHFIVIIGIVVVVLDFLSHCLDIAVVLSLNGSPDTVLYQGMHMKLLTV